MEPSPNPTVDPQQIGMQKQAFESHIQPLADIHEKKTSHVTETAAAEDRFRILFECSSEAHFLLQDGRVLDCNMAAVNLLGCPDKAELLKLHPADFSPEFQPDGRPSGPTRREIDKDVIMSGFARFEWNLRRRDGTDVFVEVSLTAIKLNGKDAIVSVCHDLTQRKQAEHALAEAKRFAESVADHTSCLIYLRRLADEAFTYMNKQCRDFTGIKPEESDGTGHEFDRNFFHPADFDKVLTAREAVRNCPDGQVVEYQARCRQTTGEYRNMLHRKVVFQRDAQGRPTHIMGTAQDITGLVRIQEELTLAKETAEAATRAKSDFLANMSHEIRTPMTAIMGYTDLLVDPKQSVEDRAGFAEVVRRNGQHLLGVLNDILDISKIEDGKMSLEFLEFDPSDVLQEVKTLMSAMAAEKNLSIGIEQRGDLPQRITADPTRLKQILLNLVGNAVKFTSAGSVGITMSAGDPGDCSCLRFDITDTGIGMTAQQMSRLFTPFGQADSSMNRRFGGSGLGLVICKRLAGMLGGDLSVTSEPGVGSTFSLVLNLVDSARTVGKLVAQATGYLAPEKSTGLLAGRILVAEDTLDTRRLVTLYLAEAGATVEAVSNGLLAVDAVIAAADAGNPFDLVVMDMQMPELDGYCATAKLRKLGFKDLPIIACTAHAMREEHQQCLRIGCNDCVAKPIDCDELIRVVQCFVGNRPRSPSPAAPNTLGRTSQHDTLVRRLLVDYIAGLPQQVAEIAGYLEEPNLDMLKLKVHQLRGSGGSYGFPQVSRQAELAERLIDKSQRIEVIACAVEELLVLLRSVDGYNAKLELSTSA